MCKKCGKNNCCCQKVTSLRGTRGERGLKGTKGEKGDPGEPGTSQTEINLRAANAAFSDSITLVSSPVDDTELSLTATADGKHIISYSGSVRITANGDTAAGVSIIIMKNGVLFKSVLYTFNNAAVAYVVNQEEWKPVTIFDTIDLLTNDVVSIRYERVNNPAPNINSTMIATGSINLIKIQ